MTQKIQITRSPTAKPLDLHLPAPLYDSLRSSSYARLDTPSSSYRAPSATRNVWALVSRREAAALKSFSREIRIEAHELLWCGLDCLMRSMDDQDVILSVLEASNRRFKKRKMPGWARRSG